VRHTAGEAGVYDTIPSGDTTGVIGRAIEHSAIANMLASEILFPLVATTATTLIMRDGDAGLSLCSAMMDTSVRSETAVVRALGATGRCVHSRPGV
jgi:hypothetical protein